MTLPSAPSAISFNDISIELFSTIQSYCLNDSYGRCITCLPTPNTTISLSNFYGKSAPITTLGTCCCGGWYMGCTTACGVNYYLIAAPNTPGYTNAAAFRTGCSVCSNLGFAACAPLGFNPSAATDGYYITKFVQSCPNYALPIATPVVTSYPLMSTTWGLSINGYSDWYMPAVNELVALFCNTDQSWRCGGAMKLAGDQFPICSVKMPCVWPYIGYTQGRAPGPTTVGAELGFTCSSGWPLNCWIYPPYSGLSYTFCIVSSTQASSNPFQACPTTCAQSTINWQVRMWCNPYPQPPSWQFPQKCINQSARAVRRVAF